MCYQSPHRIIAASIRDLIDIQIPHKSPSLLDKFTVPFSNTDPNLLLEGYDTRFDINNTTMDDAQDEMLNIYRIFHLSKQLRELDNLARSIEDRETLAKRILEEHEEEKYGGQSPMVPNIRKGGLFGGLYEEDQWKNL